MTLIGALIKRWFMIYVLSSSCRSSCVQTCEVKLLSPAESRPTAAFTKALMKLTFPLWLLNAGFFFFFFPPRLTFPFTTLHREFLSFNVKREKAHVPGTLFSFLSLSLCDWRLKLTVTFFFFCFQAERVCQPTSNTWLTETPREEIKELKEIIPDQTKLKHDAVSVKQRETGRRVRFYLSFFRSVWPLSSRLGKTFQVNKPSI